MSKFHLGYRLLKVEELVLMAEDILNPPQLIEIERVFRRGRNKGKRKIYRIWVPRSQALSRIAVKKIQPQILKAHEKELYEAIFGKQV